MKKAKKVKKIKSQWELNDELWAEAVKERAGNKCEKCGSTEIIQAHHIVPRTKWGLRYDLENGVCLCRTHHLFWAHQDGVDFYGWISQRRDMEYLELKRSNQTKLDHKAIEIYLKSKL